MIILEQNIASGAYPIECRTDNFDTFGDSDGNKKFTRVSELQSPDHKMLASQGNNNPLVKRNQQAKDLMDQDPYQNQSY